MATLTVRNLPPETHDALRRQAAANRRSMEAEARAVLQEGVRIRPDEAARREALERLWARSAEIKAKLPPGWSVVDEFLAEKHLDGAWENGRVSDEERLHWLAKLERYEAWPADIEAFLETRRGD